jgi:hypothetical protein
VTYPEYMLKLTGGWPGRLAIRSASAAEVAPAFAGAKQDSAMTAPRSTAAAIGEAGGVGGRADWRRAQRIQCGCGVEQPMERHGTDWRLRGWGSVQGMDWLLTFPLLAVACSCSPYPVSSAPRDFFIISKPIQIEDTGGEITSSQACVRFSPC